MADLDRFLYESGSSQKLFPVLARILCTLDDSPNLPQAWEPLPGNFFGGALPGGIASCWAFALRGGGIFTNERHPNSWQRSIGIRGTALFEVYDDGRWQPRPVTASGLISRQEPCQSRRMCGIASLSARKLLSACLFTLRRRQSSSRKPAWVTISLPPSAGSITPERLLQLALVRVVKEFETECEILAAELCG